MTLPISPITKKASVRLAETFKSRDIIELYRQQLNMDVSRFFTHDHFFLFRCNDTGYRFYHPKGMDGDGKFYEDLQTQLGSAYYHEWKFENEVAFNELKAGDKILDIGCGAGNFLAKAKEKTFHAIGLELNEKAVSVCRDKGLTVYSEFIHEHALRHESYYDVVCIFQVLEHIYDVKEFIEASLKVLKKDGLLIIGVPDNEPFFLGYDKFCTLNLPPHHMGLWNKNVFGKLATVFDLKIKKAEYDTKGEILSHAYIRSKYLAGIQTLAGKHSLPEKIKMGLLSLITLPATILKKLTKGLHGSHIVVVFQKR